MKKIGIIGGGIVGSTAAYYLARAGYDVTVYDDGVGQATRASAGIICPWITLRRNKPWYFLVSHGAEFYRHFMSDLEADGFATQDIYQVDGAILLRKNSQIVAENVTNGRIKKQVTPAIGDVEAMTAQEVNTTFPLLKADLPATWVSGGGRVYGEALISILHQAIQHFGGKVVPYRASLAKVNDGVEVESQGVSSAFDAVFIAAGPGIKALLEPLGYEVAVRAQKGQLLVLHHDDFKDKHWPVVIPPGQADIIPYNNGDLVIGATHEDDMADDLTVDWQRLTPLLDWARQWIPSIDDYEIIQTKVGTRAHTPDHGVLVGSVPSLDNVWAVSGLGASGLTSGPFLGYQWAQLIQTGEWAITAEDFPIDRYINVLT